MELKDNKILSHTQIQHKIRRIAYQIYESTVNEESIVVAGIAGGGYLLAGRIAEKLSEISGKKVILCEVAINKRNPKETITTSVNESEYREKALVLVDDVLNSGSTLMHGVAHFLKVPLKMFRTAVLVNRNHKRYPIKADFKGISLSTSLKEHVEVRLSDDEDAAYLL